jgi:hypothetical protein
MSFDNQEMKSLNGSNKSAGGCAIIASSIVVIILIIDIIDDIVNHNGEAVIGQIQIILVFIGGFFLSWLFFGGLKSTFSSNKNNEIESELSKEDKRIQINDIDNKTTTNSGKQKQISEGLQYDKDIKEEELNLNTINEAKFKDAHENTNFYGYNQYMILKEVFESLEEPEDMFETFYEGTDIQWTDIKEEYAFNGKMNIRNESGHIIAQKFYVDSVIKSYTSYNKNGIKQGLYEEYDDDGFLIHREIF